MAEPQGESSGETAPDPGILHRRLSGGGDETSTTNRPASLASISSVSSIDYFDVDGPAEQVVSPARTLSPGPQLSPSQEQPPAQAQPSVTVQPPVQARPLEQVVHQPGLKSRFKRVVGKLVQKYDHLAADHWTYELLGVFLCASTLISICAVLYALNNTSTIHVMANITLNTAVSILATVSRAAAGLIAASVIAQQKWLRFHAKSRSLIDVLLYDDATRGPLGSFYLLLTLHLGFVTAFAAFALVLTLGFEPFVQQSVKYPLRDEAVSSSPPPLLSVMQNLTYPPHQIFNWTVAVNAAVTQALFADTVQPLQASCGGTTCDWPNYGSIAICSSCEDAMSDLTVEPKHDTVLRDFLVNDYLNLLSIADINFNSVNGEMWMSKVSNTTYTISLGQGAPAIFNVTTVANLDANLAGGIDRTIYAPETILWNLHGEEGEPWIIGEQRFLWQNNVINGVAGALRAFGYLELAISPDGSHLIPTSAERCVISLCAEQYTSTFNNGTLSSQVIGRSWGTVAGLSNWSATLNGTYFHSSSQYPIANELWGSIMTPLFNLNGTVLRINSSVGYTNITDRSDTSADVLQFISNVREKTSNIAQGLSNFLQLYGDRHVRGQTYISKPFVEVRWAWLSFPITLVAIIFASLAVTMWQTKRHKVPIWRSSPFPLFFNIRDREGPTVANGTAGGATVLPRAVTASGHEELARETHLRLRSTAGTWVFERT